MTHYNSINLYREFKYYKLSLLVGGEGYGGFMVRLAIWGGGGKGVIKGWQMM
jgi:hypothetical protein